MRNNLIFPVLISLLSASCSVYKPYKSAVTVPDNLYGTEITLTDTSSLASVDWKELFSDRYLQTIVDTALVRNTDYRVAQLRTEQAAASLSAARLAYFPELSFGADGSVTRYDGLTAKTYNIGLNASWEIDISGRLRAAAHSATAAVVTAEEQSQTIRTQLIATIAAAYYSLLMLDRQIEIAESTLENWTETIRVMELLKAAGRTNEVAILQIKANKVGLETDIVAMKKNLREIENTLCTVIGTTPGHVKRGNLSEIHFTHSFSIGLPIQLLANRPDVRSAETEVARTHYALGEARASFYPSLTLGGTVGFTNNGGVVVNPGQWLLNAVGQLIQPVFNRGQLRANYKIAEAERKIALLHFNQTLLDAGKEVNDALISVAAARQRLLLICEQTVLLEQAVEQTELLMRHSSVNYLEVLTARQSLLSARQAEVQCRYDEIAGIISLYHALGGGR